MITGFREFEFDLPDALLTSMILTLDSMEAAPLSTSQLKDIPDAQGVYQLLLGNEIVYIGKTDSDVGLSRRLSRHARTIQQRCNLDVNNVFFKAVRVFVFTAMDLETQLIKHYKGKSATSWNNSGFGSNDPGRNRDKTRASPTSFDAMYPIDLDAPINLRLSEATPVIVALQTLGAALPYTLRVKSSELNPRLPHKDLEGRMVMLPDKATTAREVLTAIVKALPGGWQATALAGRVVLYPENEDYPSGKVIARS